MPAEKRFLVINPFGIGDVLFSTALLRCLKDAYPRCSVFYLCNKKTAPLLKNHPLVDDVVVYERDDFLASRKVSLLNWWRFFSLFIGTIRALRATVSIDLSLNTQYSFFAWMAGIKERVGLDYKKRCLFLSRSIAVNGYTDKHVAEYYLDLLPLLGIPPRSCALTIAADSASRSWAKEFRSRRGIPAGATIIAIAPCGGEAFGKNASVKRWPQENFSRLIELLLNDRKAWVYIFAGPKEKNEVDAILGGVADRERVVAFCDASLSQTVALVEQCSLFIGNDTGPLRFADGLNKKIVALFGPVDEKVYGPYPMQPGRTIVLSKPLDCRPCYHRFRLSVCNRDKECLRSITVDEVYAAAGILLQG